MTEHNHVPASLEEMAKLSVGDTVYVKTKVMRDTPDADGEIRVKVDSVGSGRRTQVFVRPADLLVDPADLRPKLPTTPGSVIRVTSWQGRPVSWIAFLRNTGARTDQWEFNGPGVSGNYTLSGDVYRIDFEIIHDNEGVTNG